jgi:hypothetical protein
MKTEGEKATKKAAACTIAKMWSRFFKHNVEEGFNLLPTFYRNTVELQQFQAAHCVAR